MNSHLDNRVLTGAICNVYRQTLSQFVDSSQINPECQKKIGFSAQKTRLRSGAKPVSSDPSLNPVGADLRNFMAEFPDFLLLAFNRMCAHSDPMPGPPRSDVLLMETASGASHLMDQGNTISSKTVTKISFRSVSSSGCRDDANPCHCRTVSACTSTQIMI
jgi:hypothetical protein